MLTSTSQVRIRRARLVLAIAGAVLGFLGLFAGTATAQDDGSAEVKGALIGKDDDGERLPIAGVTFVASDASGVEVGRAVTAEDGAWSIVVPPGTYEILLDESTLPAGQTLRNPEKNPAEVRLIGGDSKSTLFPLGEAAVSTVGGVTVVQLTVDGLKLGLIIAMCAIGLSLIYGTTGLTNFAHGESVTFGAVLGYVLNTSGALGFRLHLIPAAVIVVVISGALGALFNRAVWQPMRKRGASLVAALVVSIGFSILFRYVILFFFGGRAKRFTDYQIQSQWDLGWFRLAPKDLVLMIIAMLVLLGVALGLQVTRMGKAMRAVSDNRDLAESTGIDVEKVIRQVWIFGSALAGLGGVLFGLTESINWEMGFRVLLLMFAGVTLGGLGTAYGALFGSIIVGLFIQLSTLIIPTDMKNVGALIMLIVILLVRPQGLFGRRERIG
ncbi:branched-chain amino acid ABC transporter permease [Ilumatobacteraceae bacterium]|nr:branched-chain amino acid ABC transporter permease [Ilumatobacteraceae bacterium]